MSGTFFYSGTYLPPSSFWKYFQIKTPAIQKKKILFIGDSLNRNLNISKARFPEKKFGDTIPRELKVENYATLTLQGGTHEVTYLVVSENALEKIKHHNLCKTSQPHPNNGKHFA